jgi:hypothetical protein
VAVWEGLLDVEAAKRVIMRNEACLQAGYFIFQAGVVQKNEALFEVSTLIAVTMVDEC